MRSRWTAMVTLVGMWALALVIYLRAPSRIPTHWNMRGEIDGWGGPATAFILPAAGMGIVLMMEILPRLDPRRANWEKFRGEVRVIVNVLVLFLAWTEVTTLGAWTFGWPVDGGRATLVGMGVLLMVMGNYFPRFRSNWWMGIRTPWTLSSDRVARHAPAGRPHLRGRRRREHPGRAPPSRRDERERGAGRRHRRGGGARGIQLPGLAARGGARLFEKGMRAMKTIQRGLLAAAYAAALSPAAARAQAGASGAFVMRRGGDTIAVESFRRTATEVRGEIAVKGSVNIPFAMQTGPGASVTGMQLRARAPGAPDSAPPLQRVTVTYAGDSAVVVIEGGGQRQTRVVKGAAGAVPIVNPSTVLTEQLLMRARAVGGGDSATVTAFVVGAASTFPVRVTFRGDSAVLTLGPAEVRARVDRDGRLLGAVVPSQNLTIDRTAGTSTASRPDYSVPVGAPYTAEEVRVPHPSGFRLAGTLTLPRERRGRVPAVITITGSGLQDRDEAVSVVPGFRPFRQVADTLGRRGIAVLRMDDRGFGASEGDGQQATTRDFASDIAAAVAYLRTRPEIDPDRIALAGHSEGGVIAPMVAADDPRLRAVVLIAGTSRTGRRIIEYQIRNPLDRNTTLTNAQRDSAYRADWAQLDSTAARLPWLPFFLSYDPLPTARRVRQPVLILQGETDRQVTADQARELEFALREAGNRDVTVHVFPNLNHLLIHDPDGMPAGYSRLSSNRVDAKLLGVLADWLAEKLR
ncbi:MAG TPA: alpha/beta fold hydrolase [Longimicrobium sp.]|nr:alpha/beta fold hydrolase [Longimicrobium sp.]